MKTIKDVAKFVGVSTTTVSRVLNNKKNVSKKVKIKVNDAIKKLHYKRTDSIVMVMALAARQTLLNRLIYTICSSGNSLTGNGMFIVKRHYKTGWVWLVNGTRQVGRGKIPFKV